MNGGNLHLIEKRFVTGNDAVEHILACALVREGQRVKDRANRVKR